MSDKKKQKKKDAIETRPESEKAQIIKVEAEFGEVYFKVTKGGEIMRPVKTRMLLHEKLKHIYKVKQEFAISYPGYKHLNKATSISVLTPQRISHDGRDVPNPSVERHDRTKAVEAVAIRKIGIGFDPMGNVVAVDKSLFYNVYTYFIQSLQSKMSEYIWKDGKKTDKLKHPGCAFIGTEDEKPAKNKKGRWVFYETASPLGIWADYEHPAILECLKEHTQRQRFGDRIADTIVCRNILKDHPAIGVSTVVPQAGAKKGENQAYVWVYGWRHDFAAPDLKHLLKQAEKGSEEIAIEAEVIDEVPPEVEKEAIQDTANGEKTPAEQEEPPEEFFLEQEEAKEREPGEEG